MQGDELIDKIRELEYEKIKQISTLTSKAWAINEILSLFVILLIDIWLICILATRVAI